MANPDNVVKHVKEFFGYQRIDLPQKREVDRLCEDRGSEREVFLAAVLVARWGSKKELEETIEALEKENLEPTGEQLKQIHIDFDGNLATSKEMIKKWRAKILEDKNESTAGKLSSSPVKAADILNSSKKVFKT